MNKICFTLVFFLICFTTSYADQKTSLVKYELKPDRFGPVVIGMTPKTASDKLGVPLLPENPPDKDEISCFYVYPKGNSDDIGFMVQNNQISRIDVYTKNISSIKGIRIGDTEDTVRKAFGNKVKEEIHPYSGKDGKYLIVEIKPGYGFIFETLKGKITGFRSGKMPAVEYIEGCQ